MRVKASTKKTNPKQETEKKKSVRSVKIKKEQHVSTATAPAKTVKNETGSGIKKQYLKTNGSCSVTFRLPKEAAPDARVITVVGDFNNWDMNATPMKKMKNGDFTVTVKLSHGGEYRFRYLIDSGRWENDWNADGYVPNSFGGDDSLVKV